MAAALLTTTIEDTPVPEDLVDARICCSRVCVQHMGQPLGSGTLASDGIMQHGAAPRAFSLLPPVRSFSMSRSSSSYFMAVTQPPSTYFSISACQARHRSGNSEWQVGIAMLTPLPSGVASVDKH